MAALALIKSFTYCCFLDDLLKTGRQTATGLRLRRPVRNFVLIAQGSPVSRHIST
jgi:hypothetical protein